MLLGQILFRKVLLDVQRVHGYGRKAHTVASLVESESFLPISLFIHSPCWSPPEVIRPGTTRGMLSRESRLAQQVLQLDKMITDIYLRVLTKTRLLDSPKPAGNGRMIRRTLSDRRSPTSTDMLECLLRSRREAGHGCLGTAQSLRRRHY